MRSSYMFSTKKNSFFSGTVIALLLAALIGGFVVISKQRASHKREMYVVSEQMKEIHLTYEQKLQSAKEDIQNLLSRVKHLSSDNHRLSETGSRLSEKLRDAGLDHSDKYAEIQELQKELSHLDEQIVHKFTNFSEQRENFGELRAECKLGNKRSKKCLKLDVAKETIKGLDMQLKMLQQRRETVLSQLLRTLNSTL